MGGIEIESDLPLPVSPAMPGATATAWIRLGKVVETLPGAAIRKVLCEVSTDEFLLTVPGCARYLVRSGSEIMVDACDDAPVVDVSRHLVTYAFAALCQQRGLLALHATAIDFHGRAVLFCGPSASGASTLGAFMAARGHAVLCDHVCVVDTLRDEALVHPVCTDIGLWADALDRIGHPAVPSSVRYLNSLEKFSTPVGPACRAAVPLSAIFFIEESRAPAATIHISESRPLDAIATLVAQAFMPFLIAGLGQQASHFTRCGRALRHACVFRLARRWGFESTSQVMDQVELCMGARTARALQGNYFKAS